TEEISHETILGVAQELRRALVCDLFLLTDGRGRLLADVSDPEAQGGDLSHDPMVAAALAQGEAAAVWVDGATALQVQARRLAFGQTTVGVLVVGYRVDDRVAQAAQRQTGGAIVVTLDGKPIATSLAVPPSFAVTEGPPRAIQLAGETWLAAAEAFP